MRNFHAKKQIHKLYLLTAVGYFLPAASSWVALLALRGFSVLEIGLLESVFHIVSFCFEIPSGVVADVFGRKKTLVLSQIMTLLSGGFMILSDGFGMVALAMACSALGYNLASGTREALAYDSLRKEGKEEAYDKFSSTEMMLYRISQSTATLCAGLALWLGYRKAYALDLLFGVTALFIACSLREVMEDETKNRNSKEQLREVIKGSWTFLRFGKRARNIMIANALVGAVSTLVLFFLQAKLPLAGLDGALLGPALFAMGCGAAAGAKLSQYFSGSSYAKMLLVSGAGVLFAFGMSFTGRPYLMIVGGFVGALFDDFLEVRSDVLLNEMIPSGQRATLISVSSFLFSMVMIVMSALMGWIMG